MGISRFLGFALALLALHSAAAQTEVASGSSVTACEHYDAELECSSGVIKVAYALYGRLNSESCPGTNSDNTSCDNEVTSQVSTSCDGLSSCTVSAKNHVFGDPCYGTYKYLVVDYTCDEPEGDGESLTVCEHSTADIDCGDGTIDVSYAIYGRVDSSICPGTNSHLENCNNDETALVQTQCNGLSSCSIDAENSVFVDPCHGTYKYLTIDYTCNDSDEPSTSSSGSFSGDDDSSTVPEEPLTPSVPDGESLTVCEHSTADIDCGDGTIDVSYAIYGRVDSSICPGTNSHLENCNNDETALVQTQCNGLSSCSIDAENSVFVDPCHGTYKYLTIDYTCNDSDEPSTSSSGSSPGSSDSGSSSDGSSDTGSSNAGSSGSGGDDNDEDFTCSNLDQDSTYVCRPKKFGWGYRLKKLSGSNEPRDGDYSPASSGPGGCFIDCHCHSVRSDWHIVGPTISVADDDEAEEEDPSTTTDASSPAPHHKKHKHKWFHYGHKHRMAVLEDEVIDLNLTLTFTEKEAALVPDFISVTEVTVAGVPADATLAIGDDVLEGADSPTGLSKTYSITSAEHLASLDQLAITLQEHSSKDFTLRIRATTTIACTGATDVNELVIDVHVIPVADPPTVVVVDVDRADATAPIPLSIQASLVDQDETLAVTICNVPAEAALNAGELVDEENRCFQVSVDSLSVLSIAVPEDQTDFTLSVVGTSTDEDTGTGKHWCWWKVWSWFKTKALKENQGFCGWKGFFSGKNFFGRRLLSQDEESETATATSSASSASTVSTISTTSSQSEESETATATSAASSASSASTVSTISTASSQSEESETATATSAASSASSVSTISTTSSQSEESETATATSAASSASSVSTISTTSSLSDELETISEEAESSSSHHGIPCPPHGYHYHHNHGHGHHGNHPHGSPPPPPEEESPYKTASTQVDLNINFGPDLTDFTVQVANTNVVEGHSSVPFSVTLLSGNEAQLAGTVCIASFCGSPTLNTGRVGADGCYLLDSVTLLGSSLAVNLPAYCAEPVTVTVIAWYNTDVLSTSTAQSFIINIQAVADQPGVELAASLFGSEDVPVKLPITAFLQDTDGSETLSVSVVGFPEGSSLSKGSSSGSGAWELTADDLENLELSCPIHYNGVFDLTVTATATESSNLDQASSSASSIVTIFAVADSVDLMTSDASGFEDTATALTINAVASDSKESVSVLLSNAPIGAVFSAGTFSDDGVLTLSTAELAGLTVTPPLDDHTDFTLLAKAISTEGDDSESSVVEEIFVTVTAVADVPTLSAVSQTIQTSEDTPVPLHIVAASSDTTGSETLSATISGVPSGASLSAGIGSGDGSWSLTSEELSTVEFNPVEHSDETVVLTVTVISTESSNGDVASSSLTLTILVEAVPDLASLTSPSSSLSGTEDEYLAFGFAFTTFDNDGSETHKIVVTGVKYGAMLTAGTNIGDGTWELTPDDLFGLEFFCPNHYAGSFTLRLTTTTTETSNGESVSKTIRQRITIDPIADGVTLSVQDVEVLEDEAVPLFFQYGLIDEDSSERVTGIVISGVPPSANMNVGAHNGAGTWSLTEAHAAAGPEIYLPVHWTEDLEILITIEVCDGTFCQSVGITEAIIYVTITAQVDGATITVQDVTGAEGDSEVPLAISFAASVDPSETSSIVVSGFGDLSLSAGEPTGNAGEYTIDPSLVDLTTLSVATPSSDYGGVSTITLTTTTTHDAQQFVEEQTFTINVVAVADTPTVTYGLSQTMNEDTPTHFDIAAASADLDGSEFITLEFPASSMYSIEPSTVNEENKVVVAPADLDTWTLTPPANDDNAIFLVFSVCATESSNGDKTCVNDKFMLIDVQPVPDNPTLEASITDTWEDNDVEINLSANLVDVGEILQVAITVPFGSQVPESDSLSCPASCPSSEGNCGAYNYDSSCDCTWVLSSTGSVNQQISFTPPLNAAGTFDLSIAATSTEPRTSASASQSVSLSVNLEPVDDYSTLTVDDTLRTFNVGDLTSLQLFTDADLLCDVDNDDSLMVTVSSEFGGVLFSSTGAPASNTVDDGATATFTTSPATYQQDLESLYFASSGIVSTGVETVTVTLTGSAKLSKVEFPVYVRCETRGCRGIPTSDATLSASVAAGEVIITVFECTSSRGCVITATGDVDITSSSGSSTTSAFSVGGAHDNRHARLQSTTQTLFVPEGVHLIHISGHDNTGSSSSPSALTSGDGTTPFSVIYEPVEDEDNSSSSDGSFPFMIAVWTGVPALIMIVAYTVYKLRANRTQTNKVIDDTNQTISASLSCADGTTIANDVVLYDLEQDSPLTALRAIPPTPPFTPQPNSLKIDTELSPSGPSSKTGIATTPGIELPPALGPLFHQSPADSLPGFDSPSSVDSTTSILPYNAANRRCSMNETHVPELCLEDIDQVPSASAVHPLHDIREL